MSINREHAAQIALTVANREWGFPHDGEELVVLLDHIEESEAAWAFTFNTRSFVESGDMMRSLFGNGAIVICKKTGDPTMMPSAYSCKEALRVWTQRHTS